MNDIDTPIDYSLLAKQGMFEGIDYISRCFIPEFKRYLTSPGDYLNSRLKMSAPLWLPDRTALVLHGLLLNGTIRGRHNKERIDKFLRNLDARPDAGRVPVCFAQLMRWQVWWQDKNLYLPMFLLGERCRDRITSLLSSSIPYFKAGEWLRVVALSPGLIQIGDGNTAVNELSLPIKEPATELEKEMLSFNVVAEYLTINMDEYGSYRKLVKRFGLSDSYPLVYKRPFVRISKTQFMPIPPLIDYALTRKIDTTLASLIPDAEARGVFIREVSKMVEEDSLSILKDLFSSSYRSPESEVSAKYGRATRPAACDYYFEVGKWRVIGDVKWHQAFDEFGFRENDIECWDKARFGHLFCKQIPSSMHECSIDPNIIMCVVPDYMQLWNIDMNFTPAIRAMLPSLESLTLPLAFISYQELRLLHEYRAINLFDEWLKLMFPKPDNYNGTAMLLQYLQRNRCFLRGEGSRQGKLAHDVLLGNL